MTTIEQTNPVAWTDALDDEEFVAKRSSGRAKRTTTVLCVLLLMTSAFIAGLFAQKQWGTPATATPAGATQSRIGTTGGFGGTGGGDFGGGTPPAGGFGGGPPN